MFEDVSDVVFLCRAVLCRAYYAARHQVSLCSDDVVTPQGIGPAMHVTKKLLDASTSRELFLDGMRESITNPRKGVPPATLLSIFPREMVLYVT